MHPMNISEKSRTFNVTRNAGWAMVLHLLTILCQFVSRTIFIRLLGIDYLGINDLFNNVLMILSFTDLGIGSAIVFSMYKPLASNDTETLTSLMDFYKKAYRTIAIVIAVLGIAMVPFLKYIIQDPPQIPESLVFIYFLYVANTVVSYTCCYKKSIITADQKDYIVTIYYKIFYFLQILLQIVFLVLTQNFIVYLVIQMVCNISNNLFASRKADQMYPYIKEKPKKKLGRGEISTIVNNVRSLIIYRLSDTVMNSIDNILISALIGMKSVALCSNYLLIENSANQFIKQIINGFTASVGNLNVAAGREKQIEIFDAMMLITSWLYGYLTIGLVLLTTPLVELWLGDVYTIGAFVVFAMAIRSYVAGVQFVPYTFRTTMNLLGENRWMPLVGAAANLVLSVVFAHWFGIAGIFLATMVARLLTTTWMDIFVVFRKGFAQSPWRVYVRTALYAAVMLANMAITRFVLSLITIQGIPGFIVQVIVCSVVCNLLFLVCYCRTKAFGYVWMQFQNLIKMLFRKYISKS